MTSDEFYAALLRLSQLEVSDLEAEAIPSSGFDRKLFRDDPVRHFMTECGSTRRAQIFRLIDPAKCCASADPRVCVRLMSAE